MTRLRDGADVLPQGRREQIEVRGDCRLDRVALGGLLEARREIRAGRAFGFELRGQRREGGIVLSARNDSRLHLADTRNDGGQLGAALQPKRRDHLVVRDRRLGCAYETERFENRLRFCRRAHLCRIFGCVHPANRVDKRAEHFLLLCGRRVVPPGKELHQ